VSVLTWRRVKVAPLDADSYGMTSRRLASIGAALALALGLAAGATAASSDARAYRAHVNAICRAFTPRFKRAEADMAKAKRARNEHRYGYDLGYILALNLRQGVAIERTPIPSDAHARMAKPLRLLHRVDVQLRHVLAAVAAGDPGGFEVELMNLQQIATPLNREFDAVGLRDCGSRQQ
jgi:hypothetical protein